MTMLLPAIILYATTVFAQVKAISLTVDRSDPTVAVWLDSLEGREIGRAHV